MTPLSVGCWFIACTAVACQFVWIFRCFEKKDATCPERCVHGCICCTCCIDKGV